MWACDHPHSDSTWPHSQEILDLNAGNLTPEQLTRVVRDNCAELYGIDVGEVVVRDLERSIDAVQEQLRISRRMAGARAALQARIEAGSLGLQQLAAQVSEMAALAPPGGAAWSHGELIEELTNRLDALRAGLGDAAVMSRRAFNTIDTEGEDDVAFDA